MAKVIKQQVAPPLDLSQDKPVVPPREERFVLEMTREEAESVCNNLSNANQHVAHVRRLLRALLDHD